MRWRRLGGVMTTGIPQPRKDNRGQAQACCEVPPNLDMMPPGCSRHFSKSCHVDVMGEGDGPDG